jgi:hypothetical protein
MGGTTTNPGAIPCIECGGNAKYILLQPVLDANIS